MIAVLTILFIVFITLFYSFFKSEDKQTIYYERLDEKDLNEFISLIIARNGIDSPSSKRIIEMEVRNSFKNKNAKTYIELEILAMDRLKQRGK